MNQPIEKRLRRTLEIIRDELRLRAAVFSGLHHEKFLSPLPVCEAGWKAFAQANRNSKLWEEWRTERSGGWLGRFFGESGGIGEFDRLAKSFQSVTGLPLLDVVHDLAILDASPLLQISPSVWNWEPDDHIHEDGYVEDTSPYLELWHDDIATESRYPRHPLRKRLEGGVFSCAAAAIDVALDPQSLFLWRPYREDDVPFTICGLAENWQLPWDAPAQCSTPTMTSTATTSGQEPEYLFRNTGDIFEIRYSTGRSVEHGKFKQLKGLSHYARLLLHPGRIIPSIEFDVPPEMSAAGSSITQFEALKELEDGDNFSFGVEGGEHGESLTPQEFQELRQGIDEIKKQIQEESDAGRKKKLNQILRERQRELQTGRNLSGLEDRAQKAHRKIKKALFDARAKLKGLPELRAHLEAFVEPVGYGYVYRPDRNIHWIM